MMARDEADIIEQSLSHWQRLGVKNFYLCDNGSEDDTLKEMQEECPGAYIIEEKATDWPGRRVLNHLKDRAIDDGCDWIFPADADEFLIIPNRLTLSEWLETLDAKSGWAEIPYLNFICNQPPKWQEPHRKCFGLLTKQMTICMGNHMIEESGPTFKAHGAYYEHFPFRSFEQFRKKTINYMLAFSQTQFQDHPHAIDFIQWQREGEAFLQNRWHELTGLTV